MRDFPRYLADAKEQKSGRSWIQEKLEERREGREDQENQDNRAQIWQTKENRGN